MPYGGMVDDLLAVDVTTWQLYEERFDASVLLGHKTLSGFAAEATAANVKAETIQEASSPGKEICKRAQSEKADLIVIGSHGRKGLQEVFMGSVSNYVMHHAPCSVLVVR